MKLFTYILSLLVVCSNSLYSEETSFVCKESSLELQRSGNDVYITKIGDGLVNIDPVSGEAFKHVDGKWQQSTIAGLSLQASIARGEDSFYLVGGLNEAGEVLSSVVNISLQNGKLLKTSLPDLPKALYKSTAIVFKGNLYVIGGLSELGAKKAESDVYRIDLDGTGWKKVQALPGSGIFAASAIEGFQEIVLIGGKYFDEVGEVKNSQNTFGFRLKPVDGQTKRGWRELASLPLELSGFSLAKFGQAHIVLIGGEHNGVINKASYVYHNVTNTWMEKTGLPISRVNGVMLARGKEYLYIGGRDSEGKYLKDSVQFTSKRVVKSLATLDYVVIVVYFAIILAIGLFFAKKQDSAEEYALGNREVKWWAAGISMFATAASSISFMAIPAIIAATSLVHVSGIFFLIPMFFVSAYLTFPLLRRLKVTSTFEYQERRFGKGLRILGSIQNISMQLAGRMSVVMLLPALAVSAVTGLDLTLSILLMGGLTTVYTCFGGFEAVIWSDVMQGGMMLIGLFIIGITAVFALPDGLTTFMEVNQANHRLNTFIVSSDTSLPLFAFFVLMTIIAQMNFASDQSLAQRILCTPEKDVPKLAGTMTVCSVVVAALTGFAGLGLFAYFFTFPEQMDIQMKNDSMVPLYIVQELPIGAVGLIIAALFAASMSTLSSSMNSCAVLISEDFYKRFSKNPKEETALKVMKWATVAMGVIGTGSALILSKIDTPALMQIWTEICAVLMGGFVGVSILGLFTRRTNCGGAIVGIFASIVVSLCLKAFSDMHWMSFNVLSTLSCCLFGYLSSFIIPGKKMDLTGLTLWDMLADEKQKDSAETELPIIEIT